MIESPISNARNAIRDGDGGEGGPSESSLSNARYAVRDSHRGEGGAILESPISNARYAIGDSDRGEGGAIIESILSNARYTIRNGEGGEGGALIESPISNACYAVGSAVVGNASGDGNFARVGVTITSLVSYCYVVAAKIVVVDAIYREIFCPKDGSCHEGKKERKNLFHDMIF